MTGVGRAMRACIYSGTPLSFVNHKLGVIMSNWLSDSIMAKKGRQTVSRIVAIQLQKIRKVNTIMSWAHMLSQYLR